MRLTSLLVLHDQRLNVVCFLVKNVHCNTLFQLRSRLFDELLVVGGQVFRSLQPRVDFTDVLRVVLNLQKLGLHRLPNAIDLAQTFSYFIVPVVCFVFGNVVLVHVVANRSKLLNLLEITGIFRISEFTTQLFIQSL